MSDRRKHLLQDCLLVVIVLLVGFICMLAIPAPAQEALLPNGEARHAERHHRPQDQALHEKFYSTWRMPDNPAVSCCNDADCYPTEIKYIDGRLYVEAPRGRKVHPRAGAEGGAEQGQSRRQKPPLRAAAHRLRAIRCWLLFRAGRRHMNFVLVNGRTLHGKRFCGLCRQPIGGDGYVRDIRTQLCYCRVTCYAAQCGSP